MTDENPYSNDAPEPADIDQSTSQLALELEPSPIVRCEESLRSPPELPEEPPGAEEDSAPLQTTRSTDVLLVKTCDGSLEAPAGEGNGVGESKTLAPWMEMILAEVAKLQVSFDEKIRFDEGREAIVERLHSEIQDYKGDLVLKTMKPLVADLINLYDDIGKAIASKSDEAAGSEIGSGLIKLLVGFQSDIEEVLDRHGFEPFCSPERVFDPKCQRVLKKLLTNDETLHRVVAKSLRKGFCYEGRVIRPEMVTTYIYEKTTTDE